MGKKKRINPWAVLTNRRATSVKLFQISVSALAIVVAMTLFLARYSFRTGWLLAIIATFVLLMIDLFFALMLAFAVIWFGMISEQFFAELNRRRAAQVNLSEYSHYVRSKYFRYVVVYPNLEHLANAFFEQDRLDSLVPSERHVKEQELHALLNEYLEAYLDGFPPHSKEARWIRRAVQSRSMHLVTKRMLQRRLYDSLLRLVANEEIKVRKSQLASVDDLELDDAAEPVKAKPAKRKSIRTVSTSRPAQTNIPSIASVLDEVNKTVLWQKLEKFDLDVIPVNLQQPCGQILYYLTSTSSRGESFKQLAFDERSVLVFLASLDERLDRANALDALGWLVKAGLVRKSRDHHNRRNGKFFYKINLSPEKIDLQYEDLRQKLCQEFL
jgi:hypothetical protein